MLATGKAVSQQIMAVMAQIIHSPKEGHRLQPSGILVVDSTNPDWNTVLRKAAVIITNKGGRTSHAAIVARELGRSTVVDTLDATEKIQDGQTITISCAEGDEGMIFDGTLAWKETNLDLEHVQVPYRKIPFILAEPNRAGLAAGPLPHKA